MQGRGSSPWLGLVAQFLACLDGYKLRKYHKGIQFEADFAMMRIRSKADAY
jgi:hypothetical protein